MDAVESILLDVDSGEAVEEFWLVLVRFVVTVMFADMMTENRCKKL